MHWLGFKGWDWAGGGTSDQFFSLKNISSSTWLPVD